VPRSTKFVFGAAAFPPDPATLEGISIPLSGAKRFVHRSGGMGTVLAVSAAVLRAVTAGGGAKDRAVRRRLAEKPREAAVIAMEIPAMA
jgi:hypothetical protein